MSNVVALVPMKGHSERVSNKNLRKFNGRPLNNWVLNTLNATPEIDEIVVNTDSQEIAAEAEKFDATVIERPDHLQGDQISMNKIILHDVNQIEADYYLQTHSTNPLLQMQTISDAINQFKNDDSCDSLFSVTQLQTRLWDENGEPINHSRDELKRTQDLVPIYEENSNIYLFTEESVRQRENRIGDSPKMFPIPEEEAIDIDELIDFRIAEFLHRDRYGKHPELESSI